MKPGDKNLGLASFLNLNILHPKHSPKGYMCGVCANTQFSLFIFKSLKHWSIVCNKLGFFMLSQP